MVFCSAVPISRTKCTGYFTYLNAFSSIYYNLIVSVRATAYFLAKIPAIALLFLINNDRNEQKSRSYAYAWAGGKVPSIPNQFKSVCSGPWGDPGETSLLGSAI